MAFQSASANRMAFPLFPCNNNRFVGICGFVNEGVKLCAGFSGIEWSHKSPPISFAYENTYALSICSYFAARSIGSLSSFCSRRGLAYIDFDGNAENSSINIRNYAEKGVVGAAINAYNIRIVAEIRHVYLE